MDKIKKAFEPIVDKLRKEKVSKALSLVAFVFILGHQLMESFQTRNVILGFFGDNPQMEKLFANPVLIVVIAVISALILWGIMEGISGYFYKIFAARNFVASTKDEMKGVIRFMTIFVAAFRMLFSALYYIKKFGPDIVFGGSESFKLLVFTLFYTLAYVLLEEKSIIRANVADAYYPLQRLYKIYFGIGVAYGAIMGIISWKNGELSPYNKVMLFVEIAIFAAFVVWVRFFLKFLIKRQNEAKDMRASEYSSGDSENIQDILANMGVDLGENYQVYTPSDNAQGSQMPGKDDIVITVEPKDVDKVAGNGEDDSQSE